jgi:antitoxin ParD1/3/4
MIRQSISLTTPNDTWLNTLVAREEYASKSEVVNDLIRKARAAQNEMEYIHATLLQAEQSGFSLLTREEILAKSKSMV